MRDSAQNRKKLSYELQKIYTANGSKEKEQYSSVRISEHVTSQRSENKQLPTKENDHQTSGDHFHSGSYSGSSVIHSVSSDELIGIKESILRSRKESYRLRGHLHGKLHLAYTDEERYQLANQIMELQPKIDQLNKDLKDVNSGTIPNEYIKTELSAADYIRIQNLKLYISRYKKKIEKAISIEQRNRYIKHLEAHEKELSKLL
jgi:hypothetical protein